VKAAVANDAAVRHASARTSARSRQVLGDMDESDLQGIVDLLKSVCDVQIAAIGVQDDGAFHYLVTAGTEALSAPVARSLCQHAMGTPGVFVVTDTSLDERVQGGPEVNGTTMALRFYASAPVLAPDGCMVGRLCVFDALPRELTSVQEQALLTLGDLVGKILRLRLDRLDEADAVPLSRDLEMAARVSHDLRMPLAALNASLELLDETTEATQDATVEMLVRSARRSVDRMSGLVDGLMRLHELTTEPRRSEVDLERVARRVCADLRPLIEGSVATVRVGALPTVLADPDLMYSVLLNLVSNAVKFARPGVAPLVRLHGRRVDGGWRISVEDNGTGVPAQQREAVFGMFTRLTDAPGHGIGLTTVAQIIRAHGGLAGVDDADGPGSEFWFELPDA
jgi:signal transduction histidine kinase